MRHPAMNFNWLRYCLIFLLFLTLAGFAAAQETTTAPPPPPDTQGPSLQEPPSATDVRAVRISDVQGTVQVLNGSEVAFHQAELNMPVIQGMKLIAADDGRVEIQFEDGSVARVTPNSSITLTQLSRNPDGSTVTTIEANTGLTYYELNGRAGQYTVRFGQDSIMPNDSSIFRVDLDSTPELAVTHGSVHVSNDEGLAADVRTNQSARFNTENPNEYQLVESVTANSWDQWNSDRDEALAELDNSATEARASTGNPDNPAWSDLDANGNWYDVPGYGTGWAPSGVGDDWDPYGLGSWGYYNGIGYTWISGYSWGWWPYHCGAWSWFSGFGWMWFPGNCGWGGIGFDGGWYPYGVIWTIPPGYKCLRRPKEIHHPGHGPLRPQPLIAVNRGLHFTQQFGSVGIAKAQPRAFQYEGQRIPPIEHSIYPHQGGPLGEGFTSATERTNPSVMVRRAYGGVQYGPSTGGGHMVYQPSHIYTPPTYYTPPPMHPVPAGGGRAPAPVYRAPAPEVHSASPAEASHPHR
jgi:Family of unknown function (DUF6600)